MTESFKHVRVAQVAVSNVIAADLISLEFRLANPSDPAEPIPLDVQYSMPLDLATELHSLLGRVIEDLRQRNAALYRRDPV